MKDKKMNLRTWMIAKVIPAVLLVVYYWMWARTDFKQSYMFIQNIFGCLAGGFFAIQLFYGKKRDVVDEFAREILYKTDSFCLKICYTLMILIAFASVIFELTGIQIGYLVVGSILVITIIRAVNFCVIDSRGI